ncbi:uncharacterized protein LOC122251069 [Penaeus japonicus]|uniref:uncharacterized protein LOC122251069 n=1 Tax=Penaeus japonicus TaxID=27405 RepID=UPI001C70F70C|nr:uncharacterized protein LOC122251069 [Penaeus japonicus]
MQHLPTSSFLPRLMLGRPLFLRHKLLRHPGNSGRADVLHQRTQRLDSQEYACRQAGRQAGRQGAVWSTSLPHSPPPPPASAATVPSGHSPGDQSEGEGHQLSALWEEARNAI